MADCVKILSWSVIDDLQEEIEGLECENQDLEDANQKLENENDDYMEKNVELSSEIDSLKEDHEALEREFDELKGETEDLDKLIDNRDREIECLCEVVCHIGNLICFPEGTNSSTARECVKKIKDILSYTSAEGEIETTLDKFAKDYNYYILKSISKEG